MFDDTGGYHGVLAIVMGKMVAAYHEDGNLNWNRYAMMIIHGN